MRRAKGPLADAKGRLHIDVDHVFEDVPSPDVLLVPGGNITREMARQGDPVIDWVRSAHEHTTYTTSVCTGSLLLGAAGLLQGKKATTHWLAYDELRKYGAEPTEQRVVFQGKIVTGAGVSAGIDLALEVIARLSGAETAQSAQLLLEYDPQPPYDTGSPRKAPPKHQGHAQRPGRLVELVVDDAHETRTCKPTPGRPSGGTAAP
ncbi:DJ-1/PfpI family protein [Actinomadura madurae]|uniref:DJ-1/PfpI family protein n=1 Tax=Actinomadura madurae TaxID=1993 RepID=UPI0020D231D4|nr:DJ-1/PfpI family protein [Actinomadura madurae]MCP9951024.1 DJ-1/PfpI family protein [Actinomadura madurae]